MASPLRSQIQETYRAAIRTAASEVFVEAGFEKAKMAVIAERAGVSVGSVYNYFGNKEAIFEEILQEDRKAFIQATHAAREADTPLERLRAVVALVGEFIEARGALYEIYLKQFSQHTEDDEASTQFRNGLEEDVRAAQHERVLRDDHDADTICTALSGLISGVVQEWVVGGRETSLPARLELMLDIFFHGAIQRD